MLKSLLSGYGAPASILVTKEENILMCGIVGIAGRFGRDQLKTAVHSMTAPLPIVGLMMKAPGWARTSPSECADSVLLISQAVTSRCGTPGPVSELFTTEKSTRLPHSSP